MASFRFNNDNFLAIYKSEVFGNFTLSVRGLQNGRWEWTLGTTQPVVKQLPDGREISFPLKGVEEDRALCMGKASVLWSLDPDFYPSETHDGLTRLSLYWGWREIDRPMLFPPMGASKPQADGKYRALVIVRGESWE